MYGLRTVTPFAFGLSGISISRFFILNVIGALAWSVVVVLVGYLFGAAARAVMVDVRRYEHWIIIGILWNVVPLPRSSISSARGRRKGWRAGLERGGNHESFPGRPLVLILKKSSL